MMTNAPKPISAEPAARPSRPSVTFTALVVAQMIPPDHRIHTMVGTSMPRSDRVTEMVSEIPVPTTSHHAIAKLAAIVM